MIVLLALLALLGPPRATIAGAPLAVSSWCWGTHCAEPLNASTKTAVVTRGSTVTVELAFAPATAHVAVAGRPVRVSLGAHSLSWAATRGGSLTVTVSAAKGWVTYVGRLRLH